MAPVAIHTDWQGRGIGQNLIKYGIYHLKKEGVTLMFTYGDPNYFSKVGFSQITEKVAKAPLKLSQPEGWLCQSLVGSEIEPITSIRTVLKHLIKLSTGRKIKGALY